MEKDVPNQLTQDYGMSKKHPTRTHPQINVAKTPAITLFKNMVRTLYCDGSGKSSAECFELVLTVMPFFREHCQKYRSKWDSFYKFKKGMMNLLNTTNEHMKVYFPKSDRKSTSLERRAGIHLTHALVQSKTVLAETEVGGAVVAEIARLKVQGDTY